MSTEYKALTIEEFCKIYGKCCRGTFYNMVRAGLGPRIFHVGGRRITQDGRTIPNGVRISREAAEEWLRQREAAAMRDHR